MSTRATTSNRWQPALKAGLLILLTLLVYLPVFHAGFIWDDDEGLTGNPFIGDAGGLRGIWFSTRLYDYFPLTYTSFWLEWWLWGGKASGYHVTNVLLHAIGTLLLWRVLLRLRIPGAWLAALVFGVHPVGVASVAWISERKNTLSLVFYFLSILWYLRFDSESRTTHHATRKWYWLSLFAFLLALLSKTSVVTLPIVLLLCVWWRRSGSEARGMRGAKSANAAPPTQTLDSDDFARVIPFFALAFVLGLVTVWFQLLQPRGVDVGYQSDSLLVRLIGGSWAVWFYLWKALLPVGLTMIYPRWAINPASVVSYLPGLLWVGLLYSCWRQRRSWGRPLLFGLGCFWVSLWPVLGFFDMRFLSQSRVGDHWAYLALPAVIALVVGGALAQVSRWESGQGREGAEEKRGNGEQSPFLLFSFSASVLAALVVVAVLSIQTWRQASLYAHPEKLWKHCTAINPNAAGAWINLGIVVDSQGRFAEAEGYYRKALELNPTVPVAYNNLGFVQLNLRRLDEALPNFLKAIQIKPDFAEAWYNLGVVQFLQGKPDEAMASLQKALYLKPNSAGPHYYVGTILAARGQLDDARAHFQLALKLGHNPAESLSSLGKVSLAQGRLDEAIQQFRDTLRLRPNFVDALNNLAWIHSTHMNPAYRDGKSAVILAERAASLTQRQDTGILDTLAAAYAEAGRFEDAVRVAKEALGLAEINDDRKSTDELLKRVVLYQSGKPCRE